jgi:hypothetical protein
MHGDNTFATLTYDDEHLPEDGSVHKRDVQLFLKRLRKHYKKPLRYFAVGEYGESSLRPHYHIILFGYPNCAWINTRPRKSCCNVCDFTRQVWECGNVYLGTVSDQSAAYCASYTVKGWTKDTPHGLNPEFVLASRKPALAHDIAWEIASEVLRLDLPEIPRVFRVKGKVYPIGRYILEKASKYAGGIPIEKALHDPSVSALSVAIYSNESIAPRQKLHALREGLIAERIDRVKQMEGRISRAQRMRKHNEHLREKERQREKTK